jgi:hypothetical protein
LTLVGVSFSARLLARVSTSQWFLWSSGSVSTGAAKFVGMLLAGAPVEALGFGWSAFAGVIRVIPIETAGPVASAIIGLSCEKGDFVCRAGLLHP